MHSSEHYFQILQILLVVKLPQFLAIVLRYPINPLSTFRRVALDDFSQKVLEIEFLLLGHADCHAHVDEHHLDPLFEFIYQPLNLFLVLVVLVAEFSEVWAIEAESEDLRDEVVFGRVQV